MTETTRFIRLATICLSLGIALAGCGIFNPDGDDRPIVDPPLPPYPKLSDPYQVMAALELAYSARDSNEIKLIYDDSYQGTSVDQTQPEGSQVSQFTKSDEVAHVAGLKRRITATVSLKFPPSLQRSTNLADPPGWATIQIPPGQDVTLHIDDSPTSYFLVSGSEQFEFKFIPTTPDSTSPTDTTWKIIRWTEIRQ